jgi:uncharacterized protein (DUF1778 family)
MKAKTTTTNHPYAAEYYKKKKNHFMSIWLADPDLKQKLKEAAKEEGRTLNNFVNTYIVPEIEAVLLEKEMKKNRPARTASQRLAEAQLELKS